MRKAGVLPTCNKGAALHEKALPLPGTHVCHACNPCPPARPPAMRGPEPSAPGSELALRFFVMGSRAARSAYEHAQGMYSVTGKSVGLSCQS